MMHTAIARSRSESELPVRKYAPNGPITLASFGLCTSLTPSQEWIGGASCNGYACHVDTERAARAGGDHGIDVEHVIVSAKARLYSASMTRSTSGAGLRFSPDTLKVRKLISRHA